MLLFLSLVIVALVIILALVLLFRLLHWLLILGTVAYLVVKLIEILKAKSYTTKECKDSKYMLINKEESRMN